LSRMRCRQCDACRPASAPKNCTDGSLDELTTWDKAILQGRPVGEGSLFHRGCSPEHQHPQGKPSHSCQNIGALRLGRKHHPFRKPPTWFSPETPHNNRSRIKSRRLFMRSPPDFQCCWRPPSRCSLHDLFHGPSLGFRRPAELCRRRQLGDLRWRRGLLTTSAPLRPRRTSACPDAFPTILPVGTFSSDMAAPALLEMGPILHCHWKQFWGRGPGDQTPRSRSLQN